MQRGGPRCRPGMPRQETLTLTLTLTPTLTLTRTLALTLTPDPDPNQEDLWRGMRNAQMQVVSKVVS